HRGHGQPRRRDPRLAAARHRHPGGHRLPWRPVGGLRRLRGPARGPDLATVRPVRHSGVDATVTAENTKSRPPTAPTGPPTPGPVAGRREWYWLKGLLVAVAAFALLAIITQALPDYYVYTSVLVVLAGCGAVALNLLMGYAGQVSIGNGAFL